MKTFGVFRVVLAAWFWAVATLATAQNFEVLRMFGNGDPADATYPNGLTTDGQILYGSASQGGADNQGAVYTIATNGTGFNFLKQFAGFPSDGSSPNEVTLSGAMIFGTTANGGAANGGIIYRLGTNGGGYTILRTLGASSDPVLPQGALTLAGATLYGTSMAGGSNGGGAIFRIDTNGANFTVMRHLASVTDGAAPWGKLLLNDATLYGTTREGGTNNNGVLFKVNTNGSGYTVIYQFGPDTTNARASYAGLTMVSNVLYGTCGFGGSGNAGAVFRVGTNGSDFSVIHSFTNAEGFSPQAPLTYSQGRLYGTTIAQGRGFSGMIFQLETNGANFRVVKNLTNSQTGSTPKGSLIPFGNVLYGAANFSGASNGGTLYRILLAPVITAPPQNLTVTNGQTANFSVSATDESPLTYQWYFNTNTLLAGQTNSGLTLAGVNFGNSGNYTVVVADGLGAVTSSPALLTVVAPPFITAQPQSLSLTNGDPAVFSVTAINNPLGYQWYFNTNTALAGQTNSALNFAIVFSPDAGAYTVVITNNNGAVTSSPAFLTVSTNSRPVIFAAPQNLTVTNGAIATFTVTAVGANPLFYRWYSNSVSTNIGLLIAGRTNSSLSYTNVGTNFNARYFSVVISNSLGRATSSPALLTVISVPLITSNPQPVTVFNGNNATFDVTALGPNLRFQWYSNTVNTAIGTLLATRTNSSVTFTNVGTNFAARYFSVVVSNQFGRATSSPALLTVISAPLIISNPLPVTVTNGNPANFLVVAGGANPLRYQWYFNTNTVLTNLLGSLLSTRTNDTLAFAAVSNSLAGRYSVIVSNTFGTATSTPALLTILPNGIAPVITLQPSNATIALGGSIVFISAATGTAPLAYQWFFNTNTAWPGATATNLVITNANLPGFYALRVTNDFGAATSTPALLTITAQPTMLTAIFDPVTGSYAFSYQFLGGSTNRLWASTNLADLAAWRAIATNIMATNGVWQVTDSNASPTIPAKFYRFSSP